MGQGKGVCGQGWLGAEVRGGAAAAEPERVPPPTWFWLEKIEPEDLERGGWRGRGGGGGVGG